MVSWRQSVLTGFAKLDPKKLSDALKGTSLTLKCPYSGQKPEIIFCRKNYRWLQPTEW